MKLPLVLTLLNFALLIPGVILPIYGVSISSEVNATIIPEPVPVDLYEQTRSILGTVQELWQSSDYLVSFLILLFSVIVPVTKGTALLASLYAKSDAVRRRLVQFVHLIGKWSMADVFVVAVLLAFLATRDQAQTTGFSVNVLLQQVDVDLQTRLTSTLGAGFYFFLAYCLFSILWTQVMWYRHPAELRGDVASRG